MGLDTKPSSFNAIKHRLKHVRDIRNPPWTDGIGSQDTSACAVEQWRMFYDSLPANISNKISKTLRGICPYP